MTNVFVSYSRQDKARVQLLVGFIDSLIGEVWWDDRFVAGESFTEETERRLNVADFVVVVWTEHSAHSKWVLDEAAVGRDAGKLIPVSFDGGPPPLGFRHVHTLDFSRWDGTNTSKCALALKAALLRVRVPPVIPETAEGGVPGPREAAALQSQGVPDRRFAESGMTGKASAPTLASASHAHRLRHTLVIGVFALFGIALIGGLSIGAISMLGRGGSEPASIAEVTASLLGGRPATEQAVAQAKRAVAEIGASRRPEEKAAFTSFAAGDEAVALDILEKLAADLERAGDRKAAAEAYTRVGAIALLVDQGRGLAARRKAFDLNPESLEGFQGLFFDTFLLRGYDAAAAFAEGVIERPDVSDRLRGYAYAHLAIIAMDGKHDEALAAERVARVRALFDRTKDPVLEAAALYAAATVDWRRDRLVEAEEEAERAAAIRVGGAAAFPAEVALERIRFAQGDWAGAFANGASALDARKRAGQFLPTPLLQIVCLSGLDTDQTEAAAPYCEAQAGRADAYGGAGLRALTAKLAAARGDFDRARSELAASRALAGAAGPSGLVAPIEADRVLIEAEMAAKGGDLTAAQDLVWRNIDLVSAEPNARSLKARALRLYGLWALKAGDAGRACKALAESGDLYTAIGGKSGAAATKALGAAAKCR